MAGIGASLTKIDDGKYIYLERFPGSREHRLGFQHAKMNTAIGKNVTEVPVYGSPVTPQVDATELKDTISPKAPSVYVEDEESKPVNSTAPAGVRKMEAITLVWTKPWMIAAYALWVYPSYT